MSKAKDFTWNPDDFIIQTDELKDIVFELSSLSILAGPGAGKTEMLAQKSVFLIENNICPWPKKILFLTFKTEAAKNVKDRVSARSELTKERFSSKTYHAFAKSIVDKFRLSLSEGERPDTGYDIVFKGESTKQKVHINDIIKLAIKIVKRNEKISTLFTASYTHIFLDEFQDTTIEQYELISTLFSNQRAKLICVGDLNQSIMRWANADPEIYNKFERDFSPEKKMLVNNFRASENVKSFLNKFVIFVESGKFDNLPVLTARGCSFHVFDDDLEEADYFSTVVQEKISSGVLPSEICVITKQKPLEYTQKLCDRLKGKEIQHVVYGAFQDSLSEPLGVAFSLILECLLSRSPKAWEKLNEFYQDLHYLDLSKYNDQSTLHDFVNFFSSEKREVNINNVDEIITFINKVIKEIDFKAFKAKWPQYKSKDFVNFTWKELTTQLKKIFPVSKSACGIVSLFCGKDAVQIMNIHKCKGLEYKVVLLLGFEDDAFWSYSDSSFEERCVLYVAFTRAKDEIIVSQSLTRSCISSGKKQLSNTKLANVEKYLVEICGMDYIRH